MREQAVPQAQLTPDTGIEQQRLALPVDPGVDPQSPTLSCTSLAGMADVVVVI